MKIIHCADIHLDSPLKRLEENEKRKERKAELVKAFTNMVDYANANDVEVVIIAGDLFDQSKVSAFAKNAVLGTITKSPAIDFYYIKGNHDKSDFLSETDDVPSNLHMFDDEWTMYDLGENVMLYGVELTKENSLDIYSKLSLNPTQFNIVSLHGQESLARPKDDAQVISIKDLQNKGIDYLALGHIHAYKEEKLDGRGVYCYPGCLESRGFDETDEHGFIVLDINTKDKTLTTEKVSRPIRLAHVLPVDISSCMNSTEILNAVKQALNAKAFPSSDMVKIELVGDIDLECEINPSFILSQLSDNYYDFKLKNKTSFKVDYETYKLDESLKGEFVRAVESEVGLSEEDKAEIIRIGIKALKGEEVE